jgi:hypothetical protein
MSRIIATTSRITFALGLMLATAATSATAQVPEKLLPEGKDLVAKYRAAIGGVEALAGRKSLEMTGEFSMPAQGITAAFMASSSRPNRSVMKVTLPGFGDIRSGYNGEVGWSMNPMEGPRLLQGAEVAQAKDDAEFESFLRPESLIKAFTTIERTKIAGRDCYKVKVEWKSGRESFDCYSPDTGLIVASIEKQESSSGSMEATTLLDDYKVFNGVKMPTKLTIQVAGTEQVITLKDVKFDGVSEATFELPAEIKALIKK